MQGGGEWQGCLIMQYGVGASRRYAGYAAYHHHIRLRLRPPYTLRGYPRVRTTKRRGGGGGDRDGGTVQSNADWKILMGLSIRGSSLRPPLFPSLLPEIPEIIFSYNRTFDGRPIFISEEKLILIDHLIRWSISFVIGWRKLLIMNVRSVSN